MPKYKLWDGRKAVDINNPDIWTPLGVSEGTDLDKLYSSVAWLYRCVRLISNSVASMPFEIRRRGTPIITFDGTTFDTDLPKELLWLTEFPTLLGKTTASNLLSGQAYWEQRNNIIGTRVLGFNWMLPSTITPVYNFVPNMYGMEQDYTQPRGTLLHFWRTLPLVAPIKLDLPEVAYFWYPDHTVEIGPAQAYPGKAVLMNAGVIGSMDVFLKGYFERGMIRATLLKYKDAISQPEAARVKEWWRRTVTGMKNAFASEIVRGDFEVMTIGEGIKDLRDNALTEDEKEDIAVGMGVPISKLLPEGVNRATKDGDDRGYIEDTVLPEVGWQYKTLNQQIFEPMGLYIAALPERLRVMQADELERAGAFASYVGAGMSVEAAVGILGISVPEDVSAENETAVLERQVMQGNMDNEAALAASNQAAGGDIEKIMLNGVQITAALQIVEKYAEGLIPYESAVNMYQAFLGIDPAIGHKLIPSSVPERTPKPIVPQEQVQNEQTEQMRSVDIIELIEKRDELDRFKRWQSKHPDKDVSEFKSTILTDDEKSRSNKGRINNSLPPMPPDGEFKLDEDDPAVTEAMRRFDKLFPAEAGLLNAQVEDA